MCGFAGIWTTRRLPETPALQRMGQAIANRGPDEQVVHTDPQAGIAVVFQRLQVIDPEGGSQPLFNENRQMFVCCNGEIYNHAELRDFLISQGHTFTSRSDCEPIIHYCEHTEPSRVAEKLVGMFSVVVWNGNNQQIHLFRDRMGQKPLYYAKVPGGVCFASQPRALLAGNLIGTSDNIDSRAHRGRWNAAALTEYLQWGYVPPDMSAFEGIHSLRPGHMLTIRDPDAALPESQPYWQLPCWHDSRTGGITVGERVSSADMRSLIEQAVSTRMYADVPLGAMLSGGIDSTIVAGLMAKYSNRPVQTFTIGFDDPRYDESHLARHTAQRLGTDHHELIVRPDPVEMLEQVVAAYDEPFADSSAIPMLALCRMARQQVTVALAGDGADELFGGYDRYRAMRQLAWLDRVPTAIRTLMGRLGRNMRGNDLRSLRDRVGRWLRAADAPALPDHAAGRHGWTMPRGPSVRPPGYTATGSTDLQQSGCTATPATEHFHQWYRSTVMRLHRPAGKRYASMVGLFGYDGWLEVAGPALREAYERQLGQEEGGGLLNPLIVYQYVGGDEAVRAAMLTDVHTYLPGDLLVKADRASMAASLELRAPFMDHRVVEAAYTLMGPDAAGSPALPFHAAGRQYAPTMVHDHERYRHTAKRLHRRRGKVLLREMFADILDEKILRQPKRGFGVPLGKWFRKELYETARDILHSQDTRERGLVNVDAAGRLLDEHRQQQADHGQRLWGLLVLELWARRYCG